MTNAKRKGGLKTTSLVDYKSFQHYRDSSKLRSLENTPNFVEHGKILSMFYQKIGEKITTSEGGVFIKDLGYFSGIVDTLKSFTIFTNSTELMLNRATSGYKFYLIFVPISKDDILREWVADSGFTPKIKKAFSDALKGGFKYYFNPNFFIKKQKVK